MMLRILILLTMMNQEAISHPASCTEDLQCSTGFYCEDNNICRECLRCGDLGREAPGSPDFCVKTVMQCGPCLKGHEKVNAECVSSGDGGAPHAYLPSYAWAAVGVALLLMVITLTLFLKMKTLKFIDFSSRTSVQSLRAADAPACQPLAPPPYNSVLPSVFSPKFIEGDAPEIQRLVDSPPPRLKPMAGGPPDQPREASASQAARVFNQPAYVRAPDATVRCKTPEGSMATVDSDDSGVMDLPRFEVIPVSTRTDISKPETDVNTSYNPKGDTNYDDITHGIGKHQDTNNNRSSGDAPPGGAPGRGAFFIGGPSFVINVVENIGSVRQRNETSFCQSDTL